MPADPPFDLEQVDRLLTTTKAVRRRLDLTMPVPREVIVECLGLASHAPSASNLQEWRWIVVDDPDQRRRVGEAYRQILERSNPAILAAKQADRDDAGVRMSRSVAYLAQHMGEVPVIVVACYDVESAAAQYRRLMGPDRAPTSMQPTAFTSVMPAVWGFQLALRSRGLGSALTTAHRRDQPAVARILGIPDSWEQVALLPVAYTTGGDFRPSPRRPIEESIAWNRVPEA